MLDNSVVVVAGSCFRNRSWINSNTNMMSRVDSRGGTGVDDVSSAADVEEALLVGGRAKENAIVAQKMIDW
jgi:hypothetical protein